jgi:hypothetical protein
MNVVIKLGSAIVDVIKLRLTELFRLDAYNQDTEFDYVTPYTRLKPDTGEPHMFELKQAMRVFGDPVVIYTEIVTESIVWNIGSSITI